MTEPDRYPCPDRRCPGLIALEAGDIAGLRQCPQCLRSFDAQEIRTAPKFRQWKPEPRTNDNSHVQFWSQPIKRRLDQSTIGANQAAKRDLSRYHTLIDDALPAVTRQDAERLCNAVRNGHADANRLDDWQWGDLCVKAGIRGFHGADMNPVERLALIDAADRCIKEYDSTPEPHLPDIVARHFRITPERS